MVRKVSRQTWRRVIGGVCLGTLTATVIAGEIVQATFRVRPVINAKAGKVTSCGAALFAVPDGVTPNRPVYVFDGALQIWADGYGLGKAGVRRVTLAATGEPTTDKVAPISAFYFKRAGSPPLANKSKLIPAETSGYLLQGFSASDALQFLDALQTTTTLTVGVQVQGEKNDLVFSGPGRFDEQGFAQYMDCMKDLAAEMSAK